MVWCCCVGSVLAQPPSSQDARPSFRAGISLVELSAVVTGAGDRPIDDLTAADFEVLEDGDPRTIASVRYLSTTSTPRASTAGPAVAGARIDEVVTNRSLADAPAFVLLLDDLNVSAYDSHRAIRAALGVLGAIPQDALVSVVNTSGEGGGLITLGRPNQDHEARIKAFRGQYLLTRGGSASASSVDTPCSGGADSPDCSDPTRAGRRARALEAVGELFSRTGSRRKALFWFVTDMGVSPLAPEKNREAQFAGLQRLLGGDVTVYAVDPRENFAPTDGKPVMTDRGTGGRMRVGTADRHFGGPGGATMMLNTDDMVGVPLSQIARDTGGRWIQNANDLEKVLAPVVAENLSSYVIAYESTAGEGRHRIEVKVKRRGAKVSARRALVVAPAATNASAAPVLTDANARLAEIVRGGVPFGSLPLHLHVSPQFAVEGAARALVTVRVGDEVRERADIVDLLVLAADDGGDVASLERLTLHRPAPGDPWEGSVTLSLPRGQYQLRVAASTADGARTGLLMHALEIANPAGDLAVGVPTLLAHDERGVRPTLARAFPAGHPLAFQVEVAGDAIRGGAATARARLLDASGTVVVEQPVDLQPDGTGLKALATGVVVTDDVRPGDYTLVIEARVGENPRGAAHAIPLRVDAPVGGRVARATAPAATLTPLSVASGPLTRSTRRGPHVIRSEQEWADFWRTLPTRQAPPDIDFARVTLLAIVAEGDEAATPRITRVHTEPGGIVVQWTTGPSVATVAAAGEPLRPFVVMGLTSVEGRVRFERVEAQR